MTFEEANRGFLSINREKSTMCEIAFDISSVADLCKRCARKDVCNIFKYYSEELDSRIHKCTFYQIPQEG